MEKITVYLRYKGFYVLVVSSHSDPFLYTSSPGTAFTDYPDFLSL